MEGLEYYRNQSEIREVTTENDLTESVRIIRDSFVTVARDLNLSEANCPTNPAFINIEKLIKLQEKGVKFFGLFTNNRQSGFVAVEKASDSLFYMEKLAVLPEFRHGGSGKKLMDFVCVYVKKENGVKVSIGIINENTILKKWYQDYGFAETALKTYPQLPFTVCLMEKSVQ